MRTRSTTVTRDGFSRVGRQFQRWRSRRPRGARIPGRLWDSAVKLAQEHGVNPTARALHLNYYSLKRRVDAVRRERADEASVGRFVEIPLGAVPAASPAPASPPSSARACVLEIEDGRGARVRVELGATQGLGADELIDLVREMWEGRGR